jgi:hypothetical protein
MKDLNYKIKVCLTLGRIGAEHEHREKGRKINATSFSACTGELGVHTPNRYSRGFGSRPNNLPSAVPLRLIHANRRRDTSETFVCLTFQFAAIFAGRVDPRSRRVDSRCPSEITPC